MSHQNHRGLFSTAQSSSTLTTDTVRDGGSIGYWTSSAGQWAIELSGGWKNSSALSSRLAKKFPHLYGSGAGLNNLRGQNNGGVAAFVLVFEMTYGPESEECQTLASALDEFVGRFSPDN